MYCRHPNDRDDLMQDIRAQLWRSFRAYDASRAKFSTWMYRIALNVAISRVRSEQTIAAFRFESIDDHAESLPGGTDVEVPDARLAALRSLIDVLDPLNRALMLLYLEERSYADMAAILGISETNVATKIGRITQMLRTQLAARTSEGTSR